MSEVVTIGSATATIYGTFAAATAYLSTMFGDAYTAWLALSTDDQKRTLVAATRYIDRQTWLDAYDTFAERDAFLDINSKLIFDLASYELAALVAEDPSVVTVADSGSNIKSVGAGGAFVDYFNPTSIRFGTASKLPQVIDDMIGKYLAATASTAALGGDSQSGDCVDPFSDCVDYDRTRPF